MAEFAYYQSPLGFLEIEGSSKGIVAIRFTKEKPRKSAKIPKSIKDCVVQLDEYFKGERRQFDVELDFHDAPEFYQEVWKMVRLIPYGRTRCYSAIANILNRPNASRAVGQANGKNPIPIIIPCHRVIGKDGNLTGYVYGLEIKTALLELENPNTYHHQSELFDKPIEVLEK